MKNIVHLSKTPLVGVPGKLSELCNRLGYNSVSIVQKDYPKGKLDGKFMKYSMQYNNDKNWNEYLNSVIYKADIIHIHNDYDLLKNFDYNKKTKFIYQVHSPLREGPLFFDRYNFLDIDIAKKLVVGQFQTKLYPDFIPVPNVVLDSGSLNLLSSNDVVRVMYSPTHNRGGRWNNKHSTNLSDTLNYLNKIGKIKLISPSEPLGQDELLLLRKTCHITIDEISTGAYHQVSLEGLCAGNVVINGSDFMTSFALSNIVGAKELPPFYKCNEQDISDKLTKLVYDRNLITKLQKKSFDFYKKFLNPETLFLKTFDKIYKECINEN